MREKTSLNRLFCAILTASLLMGNVPLVSAYSPFDPYEEMQILKGDIASVPAKKVTRVAVSDPDVADISEAKENEVLVVGNKVGQSTLFVWDASGKRTVLIRVVGEDLSIVRVRIQKLLLSAGITTIIASENPYEGMVVLTGVLPEDKAETLKQILLPFEEKIINFVGKEDLVEDLVQIDMQVTELETTLTKELGVDWTTGGAPGLGPQFAETMPGPTGKLKDLFKIGDFNRTSLLTAKINALITEGKARILSKPRLVVVNGKEAKFVVGGETPIRTTSVSSSGGTSQDTVTFKEYGVTLNITPTIRKGKVDVLLSVELSDVDRSNMTSQGDVGYTKRSAQTQLFLDDRQTIVLAGLIKKSNSQNVSRIPLLGAIPWVGALFRSKKIPNNKDTEVVISLTPTIVKTTPPAAPVFSSPGGSARGQVGVAMSTIPQAIAGYAKTVQDKISEGVAFPLEAQKNGWQGVVKLEVVITRDGALKDVYIKQSSGYEVFDQNALNTTLAVAPFGAFSNDIQRDELSLTIPIMYSADAFSENPLQSK